MDSCKRLPTIKENSTQVQERNGRNVWERPGRSMYTLLFTTKIEEMKYYHLTFLRDGEYITVFTLTTSIANFLLIEKSLGKETHILYSREITEEEYDLFYNI